MKKLVVLMVAASTLAPASAIAQRTAAPPVKWEDTPRAQIRVPMAAPHAAAPAPRSLQRPYVQSHPGMQGHPAPAKPPMVVQHHGSAARDIRNDHRVNVSHSGSRSMNMRRHHRVKNYSGYHRINRGFALPHAWWGPQFQVNNWSSYNLPQPIHGGRWVRYYDDALLVDSYGRVMDGRWGMSWDQWGDQWDYDDRGVPVYVGDGDFYPGEEDYEWVDESRGRYAEGNGGHGQHHAYGAPCPQACVAPPPPGYGYPHGYGYTWGWAHGGAVVVTETTVTTSPTIVTQTYYEEEVVQERTAKKQRKYRAKPRYHRPAAPPPPGERG